MKYALTAAVAVFFTLTNAAWSQDTTVPAQNQAAIEAMSKVTTAQDFVALAAMSDMFEITSGQAALDRANSDSTKQFAQHLINDHSASRREMMTLAKEAGIEVQPPAELDERHQNLLNQLGSGGADFDVAFAQFQILAHNEGLALFRSFAQNGDNAQLKAFAMKGVPKLEQHLHMAQQIAQSKGGQTQTN